MYLFSLFHLYMFRAARAHHQEVQSVSIHHLVQHTLVGDCLAGRSGVDENGLVFEVTGGTVYTFVIENVLKTMLDRWLVLVHLTHPCSLIFFYFTVL